MFTGIIQHLGTVHAVEPRPWGRRLLIDAPDWAHTPRTGDSIAVNGVCLTLIQPPDAGRLAFDVITETLNLTTLGDLRPATPVNLERALRASDTMDGHLVQGHVDGVATVREVHAAEIDHRITIAPPPPLMEYITPKGAVTLSGVSLTIAGVHDDAFEVALIPTTLELTNLGGLTPGDRVNLETDVMARTIVHWLRRYAPKN